MSLRNLFQVDYWFTSRILVGGNFWVIFLFFAFLLLSGIILDILLRFKVLVKYRSVYKQVSSMLWTMSIMGLIWTFFFSQGIYALSARIWLVVWGIIFLLWLYFIIKYYLKIKRKYQNIKSKK